MSLRTRSLGRPCAFLLTVGLAALLLSGTSVAQVTVVDMNFDGVTGLENSGVGPDGVLVGNAVINSTAGVGGTGGMVTDGTDDIGVDLDIGAFGVFSGRGNFSLSFDFKVNTPGAESGQLFSAEGATHIIDDLMLEPPEGQEASISISHYGNEVGMDVWFFDGGGVFGTFNDGNFHTVNLDYDAAEKVLTLSSPSAAEPAEFFFDGEDFPFANEGRDTTNDVTRLGDVTNPDLILDETGDPCDCTFDNLLITGPAPPPVKLLVDRATGDLSVEVIAGDPVVVDALTIASGAGTLIAANYDGIADTLDNGPNGDQSVDPNDEWQTDVADAFDIAQSDIPNDQADDGATLTGGQSFPLGDGVWRPFFDEDLSITINDVDAGAEVVGLVEYTNGDPLIFGDITTDGVDSVPDGLINENDWIKFQSGFGSDLEELSFYDRYFLADLNDDEFHNWEDYVAFVEAYDAENGEGAFAAMVPEPGACALLMLGFGWLVLRRRQLGLAKSLFTCAAGLAVVTVLLGSGPATAAELVRYEFEGINDFSDSSSNGRTGVPVAGLGGSPPTTSGGEVRMMGFPEEGMNIPLDSAYPFDGTQDWTVELKFTTTGNIVDPELPVLLLGAYNLGTPDAPNYNSMSMFASPEGDVVMDYFFTAEVRASTGLGLFDGLQHSVLVTYVAPEDPGDPESAGVGYVNVDGVWYGGSELVGDFAARQYDGSIPDGADVLPDQTATDFEVRLGNTLNREFPINDLDPEATEAIDYEGSMDDVIIHDVSMAPSVLRAEVDATSGAVTLLGGSFARDIKYYEINSEAGSLNPGGWLSLDGQNLDPTGTGVGETWDVLNDAETQLAEGRLFGSSVFSDTNNDSVPLGDAFTPFAVRDLEIIAVTTDNVDIFVPIEYLNVPLGDFNDDGAWDCEDINALVAEIVAGTNTASFDMNGDGFVNLADITDELVGWLAVGGSQNPDDTDGNPFLVGDADLDGAVDVSDFNAWNENKFTDVAEWCSGDFTADGSVDVSDFNRWNDNKFSSSAGAPLSTVPEPGAMWLLVGLSLATAVRLRR